jgi:hypothetical protein
MKGHSVSWAFIAAKPTDMLQVIALRPLERCSRARWTEQKSRQKQLIEYKTTELISIYPYAKCAIWVRKIFRLGHSSDFVYIATHLKTGNASSDMPFR